MPSTVPCEDLIYIESHDVVVYETEILHDKETRGREGVRDNFPKGPTSQRSL